MIFDVKHSLIPRITLCLTIGFLTFGFLAIAAEDAAGDLLAGVAKIDITDRESIPVHDPLFVKALVLKKGSESAVIVTIDAVAIGEIGRIGNDFLPTVRSQVEKQTGIPADCLVVNASHCHGLVCKDVASRTVRAVREAASRLVPVHVGVGRGHEDRIMENRRLKMKDGREIDIRHAYSMPPDDEVAAVGPIDPEIGVLRLDRVDGSPLAVLYHFACHPIQGVPGKGNTADITGFSSKVIEENLGGDVVALFVQGCAGDINPASYKMVDHPRDAEPLGNRLGLSTLKAIAEIETQQDDRLRMISRRIELPRADLGQRILEMETRREEWVASLRGTTLNFESFLPLFVKYKTGGKFPSAYAYRYLQEKQIGRDDLVKLDQENQAAMEAYLRNVQTMERLTRLNTNLQLLRKHQQQNIDAGRRTVTVQLTGLRVGEFVLTTFPGELTVEIGLRLKEQSPHPSTFVAGYTNGYIYYAPTTEQLQNRGGAQEDSDCILASHWQAIYEKEALRILRQL